MYYAAGLATVSAGILGAKLGTSEWSSTLGDYKFWVLAAMVIAGELLPITVPRRNGVEEVTVSGAFAIAVLLLFGFGPAAAVYVTAAVVSDAVQRVHPVKVLFNAAQYVASLAAADAALTVLGSQPPIDSIPPALPAIAVAVAAFFLVESVLVGLGVAAATGERVIPALTADFGFHLMTTGALLAFGPIVAVSALADVALLPLLIVPILAIFFGGRQAAISSERALHDPLTGLPNRQFLAQRLGAMLAAPRERDLRVAVAVFDLDDFRTVNETLGHYEGDWLLIQLASRLEAAVGPDDLLARLGADEFALVRPIGASDDEVERLHRVLRDALESPFAVADLSIDVRASMGVAIAPEHGDRVDTLVQHASVALDRAKQEQTACELYAAEYDDFSPGRLELATQLRRGIERSELIVEYQPKLSLQPGRGHGVEALVRWQHPQLGLLGPDAFVPLAERTGQIRELTQFVLGEAIQQAADWHAAGLPVRMSVNLSPRDLLDPELPRLIDALLSRWRLPATALQLEITERGIISDLTQGRHVLESLRRVGVTSAIDDFGTGYSSLSQVHALPVDEIKIDKSFVQGMTSERPAAAIVESTIQLGRSLGLHVTAEGVEDEATGRELVGLGCDFAQGYYFGRPTNPEACAAVLLEHSRRAAMPDLRVIPPAHGRTRDA